MPPVVVWRRNRCVPRPGVQPRRADSWRERWSGRERGFGGFARFGLACLRLARRHRPRHAGLENARLADGVGGLRHRAVDRQQRRLGIQAQEEAEGGEGEQDQDLAAAQIGGKHRGVTVRGGGGVAAVPVRGPVSSRVRVMSVIAPRCVGMSPTVGEVSTVTGGFHQRSPDDLAGELEQVHRGDDHPNARRSRRTRVPAGRG